MDGWTGGRVDGWTRVIPRCTSLATPPGPEAVTAPVPSVLRSVLPDQMPARAMHSMKMSSAGAHGWMPPSVADVVRLFLNYEGLSMLGYGGNRLSGARFQD